MRAPAFFLACLLVGTANLATSTPAAAKPAKEDETITRAKTLFAKAQEHYDLGEYEEAIKLLKEAYRIYPNTAFLHNLGVCYQKNGEYEKAIESYETYLEKSPKAPNRAIVEGEILDSRKALEELAEAKRKAEEAEAERQRQLALMAQPNPGKDKGPNSSPVYKKKWFWGAVGGAVLAGAGTAIGLSIAASTPNTDLGNQDILDK
jgi:tetratricopeptide (TPR) repeat protein